MNQDLYVARGEGRKFTFATATITIQASGNDTVELEFTLGDESILVRSGDFIRVPPGTRHGFRSNSGRPVPMIVRLSPGGFEEFFYAHRAETGGKTMGGAIDEARTKYGTVYELPTRG